MDSLERGFVERELDSVEKQGEIRRKRGQGRKGGPNKREERWRGGRLDAEKQIRAQGEAAPTHGVGQPHAERNARAEGTPPPQRGEGGEVVREPSGRGRDSHAWDDGAREM
eukprot:477068-Pleurochrysis_carterae.AAC.1